MNYTKQEIHQTHTSLGGSLLASFLATLGVPPFIVLGTYLSISFFVVLKRIIFQDGGRRSGKYKRSYPQYGLCLMFKDGYAQTPFRIWLF